MARATHVRDEFLARQGIPVEEFDATGLKWQELEEIKAHHEASSGDLQEAATYISRRLQRAQGVHSLKVRIKDPEHLIAKIIRKKSAQTNRSFALESYRQEITDLIGIRALHLFKDEWRAIHDFVISTFDLHESPIAYVREGDPTELLASFNEAGCQVTLHPFGYRSIHYILKCLLAKEAYLVEVQVRTIFEEGWSEIDHQVRYPRHSNDAHLAQFLAIFNRLSGSADEMGSFIKTLRSFLEQQRKAIVERDDRIATKEADLKAAISKLKINETEKNGLRAQVEALRTSSEPLITLGATGPDIRGSGWQIGSIVGLTGPHGSTVGTCLTCGDLYTRPAGGITIGGQCTKCLGKI